MILLVALFAFALAKPEADPGAVLGGPIIGPSRVVGIGPARPIGSTVLLSKGISGGRSLGGHGRIGLH